MQIEKDKVSGQETTGHEWDGIKELNTPVPKPAIWAYAISIVIALIGWLLYPSIPFGSDYFRGLVGTTSRETVLAKVDTAETTRLAFHLDLLDGDLYDLVDDDEVRQRHEAAAVVLFNDNCAACHGTNLQGQTNFPNLVDEAWLFYNDLDEIEWTIRYGINAAHDDTRYSEMPAFGRDEMLERDAISDVTEFVLSLSGADHNLEAAARGSEVFAADCSGCHGENAEGIGIGAPNLADDFWIYGGSREAILETLNHGRAGVMPAWDQRLTDAEIRKLVLYLHWSRENGKDGD